MPYLLLLRHLKSQWNKENRFAGWTDGPLAKEGTSKILELTKEIFSFPIDVVYTSPLFRNMETVAKIFDAREDEIYPIFIHLDPGKMKKWGHFKEISHNYIPVFVSEKLNERYYGKLQGLNKDEVINKYGEEKVRLWRRSYDIAPPQGESLKDVYKRTIPFFKKYIEKDLKKGKNVLIVASHNSLRAIAKYLENLSKEEIIDFEIPFQGLLKYQFDGQKYKKLI